MGLVALPITLANANRFVESVHRHHGRLPSAKFAIAAVDSDSGLLHGVAIAGNPKARMLDDGQVLEVNRVCTDGTRNCCSFLYGACKRAAQAMGYAEIITYTLPEEGGASLKASGWINEGVYGGGAWAREGRPAEASGGRKHRWRIVISDRLPEIVWPELDGDEHCTQMEFGEAA